jgi:hypothetical protein
VVSTIPAGTYYWIFQVTDAVGNSVTKTISLIINSPASSALAVLNMSPSSGPVGSQVVITGTGFTPTGNYVNFGGYGMPNQNSPDGTTLTVTVPPVPLGAAQVYVATTFGGQSSPVPFTVTSK